jgi:hypothetical protein
MKDLGSDFIELSKFFKILMSHLFLRYIQHRVNSLPSLGFKFAPTTPNPTFTHIDFFKQNGNGPELFIKQIFSKEIESIAKRVVFTNELVIVIGYQPAVSEAI